MPLTVKAKLTQSFMPDGVMGYCADIKDFDLSATEPTFERAIEAIKPKLEKYLKEKFGTEKLVEAVLETTTATAEFEIMVRQDRQLSEFTVLTAHDKDRQTETVAPTTPPAKKKRTKANEEIRDHVDRTP